MNAVAWSGGKDSALTLKVLRPDILVTAFQDDRCVVSDIPKGWIEAQASALRIPLLSISIDDDLHSLIRQHGISSVMFGEVCRSGMAWSMTQALEKFGVKCVWPLIGIRDTAPLFLANGGKAKVVYSKRHPEVVGHDLTPEFVEKYGSGNIGLEYHTFAYSWPDFDTDLTCHEL